MKDMNFKGLSGSPMYWAIAFEALILKMGKGTYDEKNLCEIFFLPVFYGMSSPLDKSLAALKE